MSTDTELRRSDDRMSAEDAWQYLADHYLDDDPVAQLARLRLQSMEETN